MSTKLFEPRVDYIFKNLFGSEKHPRILISFLNACIKPLYPIVEVHLKNTEMTKEFIEDSFSRLDVLAKTDKGELINIEIQRKDESNMIQRSLYYWSKAFVSEYQGKSQYELLPRTICINVLDFNLLNETNYHNRYLLKNVDNGKPLTDVMEIHYIELPKMNDETLVDTLSAWTAFIKNPNDIRVMEMETVITELHEARIELTRLSRDPAEAERYRMRENAMNDRANALKSAEDKGVEKGIDIGAKKKSIEMAKEMLIDEYPITTIVKLTKLSIDEIENLKN